MAEQDTMFTLAAKALKLDSATDVETHFGPLRAKTHFTSISLNGNTLGVPAAEALAPLLAAQQQLHTINLADLFTGRLLSEIPAALSYLLTALLKCPRLTTVDLSDNAFGLNTVEPLVAFLQEHVPLQHLILNNNGLGPQAGAMVADALRALGGRKKAAKDVPELETVVCGRNRLESGSMEAWARAFRDLPGIRTVRMAQDGIRQEGIVAVLRDGLSHCKHLETLDLQDNTFTRAGGAALAKAVASWPKLRELGVGDCLVSAGGFVKVVVSLGEAKSENLEVLRAQYDEIDARGVKKLAEVLAAGGLPKLRRVELNGNKFAEDDEDVVKIRDLLKERRETAGAESDDEGYGLDELSDLESDEEDEEDESEEEEEEEEDKRERVLEDADEEEQKNVAQDKDKTVDDLADQLGKQL